MWYARHLSVLVCLEYLHWLDETSGKNRVERRGVLDQSSQSGHPLILAGRCRMDHGMPSLFFELIDVEI